MSEDNSIIHLRQPDAIDDPLTALLRSGARRLLEQAIEAEVEAFLASRKDLKLADGRERLVRHGHGPERVIQTGIGPVEVQRIKVRDRAPGRLASGSGSAQHCCHAGRVGRPAWMPCCRSCTCAASRPVISRRRWVSFWARTRRTCRPQSFPG
jgi:hypothetical protein